MSLPASISIEPLMSDDVDSVARLVALCSSRRADAQAAMLRRVLAAGERAGQVLVAKEQGRVVGAGRTAYFSAPSNSPANVVPNGWYLMGLDVHPELRRRGIAAELTRRRLLWIFERAPRIWYFTGNTNKASIALHKRFGFRFVSHDIWFPALDFETGGGLYELERELFVNSR